MIGFLGSPMWLLIPPPIILALMVLFRARRSSYFISIAPRKGDGR